MKRVLCKYEGLTVKFLGIIIFVLLFSTVKSGELYAQQYDRLTSLSKQVMEENISSCNCGSLEEIKELYLETNKHSQFVEFLVSLANKKKSAQPCISYYVGLARYKQLKYLEETQLWDEYFSQGNTYREQITSELQKVIDTVTGNCPILLESRLVLWQFHIDQQDVFHEQALVDLMNLAQEYAKEAKDLLPIKEVADKLLSYGEKGKSKELYKIYVQKLNDPDIKEEKLKVIADDLYKQGNLELSELIYDLYIERVSKSFSKDQLVAVLLDIAKLFSDSSLGDVKDMFYAGSVLDKIEKFAGKDSLNEEFAYLRAQIAEKAKEYINAKEYYLDLISRFPGTVYADQANFKIGIISLLALRDLGAGKEYLEKLGQKETVSPYVLSSLYYLGVLSQWENNIDKAKEYYNKLLEKAKDVLTDTVKLAQERLKEIEEAKPLEHNLDVFLNVSLKEEYTVFNMSKVQMKATPDKLTITQPVNISAETFRQESGCMQVELQYLWSGDLGGQHPDLEKAAFDTFYNDPGSKVICMVAVSPQGVVDRSLELVDVN